MDGKTKIVWSGYCWPSLSVSSAQTVSLLELKKSNDIFLSPNVVGVHLHSQGMDIQRGNNVPKKNTYPNPSRAKDKYCVIYYE